MSKFDFWKKTNGCILSAEIGINANGDMGIAKSLILNAALAEWNLVKFQKRHVSYDGGCYKENYLYSPRKSTWGSSQYDQKLGLEFTEDEWDELIDYCENVAHIDWYASVWDKESVDFLQKKNIKAFKVPSAILTNIELLRYIADQGKPVVLSTGMHTDIEIERAIDVFEGLVPLMLLYCVAAYPCDVKDIKLSEIAKLKYCYPEFSVGYSGHEVEITPTLIAANMGSEMIERHITIDRRMEGSDQKAALEFDEMVMLSRLISENQMICPTAAFNFGQRIITDSEYQVREKFIQAMRGISW